MKEEAEEGDDAQVDVDDESEQAGGEEDEEEKKKEMLKFDPSKLIAAEVIDLDNGTYEVKYKQETDEDVRIWVYY